MSRFFVAVERLARYTGDNMRVEVRAEMPNGMTFYRQALVTDYPDNEASASMYLQAICRMFHEMVAEAASREDQNGLR